MHIFYYMKVPKVMLLRSFPTAFVMCVWCVCSTGNVEVELRRYLKDARSIPVAGDGSGQTKIGTSSLFTIDDGSLFLTDGENGATRVAVGGHLQYLVHDQ